MGPLAGYVLRLSCGSLLSALLLSVSGCSGSSGKILKQLTGLFLTFLAISPIRTLEMTDLLPDPSWYQTQGTEYTLEGKIAAQEAFSELITDQYRAYILTRAEELSLSPEILLQTDPDTGLLLELTLRCNAAPAEKQLLTDLLCRDLGLERSAIHWTS